MSSATLEATQRKLPIQTTPVWHSHTPRGTGHFRFIDLFAGIGGFRIGLERLGGECVFSCEWDAHSQKTYAAWFGETPAGDIRQIRAEDIPNHDILAAGFPCQPFSIAGVSKKKSLGRNHGFADEKQGNLFFEIERIATAAETPVLILENVKNLLSHDRGNTWRVMCTRLRGAGYQVFHQVIDARAYVPQHRERVFIVCFREAVFGLDVPFGFPRSNGSSPPLRDALEERPDDKYTLSDHLWNYLQAYAERQRLRGNGFGYGIADPEGHTRTLSARYYKDGAEILIAQEGDRNPRRLTPREAARIMGFPDALPIVVSDTQAYRQFGNAVVPPVVSAVGARVLQTMAAHGVLAPARVPRLIERLTTGLGR